MAELTEKIVAALLTRLAIPVILVGGRVIYSIIQPRVGLSSAAKIALGTVIALPTTIVVAAWPEHSFDFVLRQIATVTNYTGIILQLAANQIRALEKVDLEQLLNKPAEYLEYILPTTTETDETGAAATSTPTTDLVVRRVAGPPPPKNYTTQNFPYFIQPWFIPRYMGDEDTDRLISAYNTLGIDIVTMILTDFQLPQMSLIRDVYYYNIRQVHPDSTRTDTTSEATTINLAYTEIKTLMSGPDSPEHQYELLRVVLQKINKGEFPTIPYVYLFVGGMLVVVVLFR